MTQEQILLKLQSLNCYEIEIDGTNVYFSCDGYGYVVQIGDIENNDTIQDMLNSADLLCPFCGNEIYNTDAMLCGICKEHV